MLQIRNIKKQYRTGDLVQTALDDVSLNFRDNEFVSILGKSGSGKSTLLNVIGGLDRYDSGNLIINGISTEKYRDRDWDSYRNHTIGFIFQSYNLIPHQSVLANVELALTISGVSRKERRKRAKEVLEKVGLGDQLHKRPSQMSGGQMQRVAIARALINNPDILLADEPTGALDTATSIQIMELLKEVAKDKLVIMVTHNPELAEKYSTRIVRLKDGRITDDSDPFEPAPENGENGVSVKPGYKNMGRAKMSFLTSLVLSFNNLKNKKGRTLLTSFAGSIGIIGIALILALSSSVDAYITGIQRETMNSYPIVINSESFNLSGEQPFFGNAHNGNVSTDDGVYGDPELMPPMEAVASKLVENNLYEFKKYIDEPDSEINQYIGRNGVKYGYNTAFQVYAHDTEGRLINTDTDPAESSDSNSIFGGKIPMRHPFGDMQNRSAGNFSQMIDGLDGQVISDLLNENYKLLYGSWPEKYDEIVLVLNRNNSLSPLVLYQLGLITADKYNEIADKTANGETVPEMRWDYEELANLELYLLANHDRYTENEHGIFTRMEDEDIKMDEFIRENGIRLRISGIIRPAEESSDPIITTAAAYTTLLTQHIASAANSSRVVEAQRETPQVDVLTGLKFEPADDAEKAAVASGIISKMGISEKAKTYQMILYMQSQENESTQKPGEKSGGNSGNAGDIGNIGDIGDIGDIGGNENGGSEIPQKPVSDEVAMAAAMDKWLKETPDEKILLDIYEMSVGETSYDENMKEFGEIDFDRPASIGIYIDSFDAKEGMNLAIEHYNESVEEENRIYYTDYVALLTSSVSMIIDTISYVLIAFVAVSLIVSGIMIGIITHISVLERTKEIGILRALGASKGNISQVFNAETFIIGACSGILGVVIASLLTIPANVIIRKLLNNNLVVSLPITYSGILTLLSIAITVLGGLLPAHKAAKKDPVEALRTE